MSDKSGVCTIVPTNQDGFRPYVIGMGILLENREVVTCAHVIEQALGQKWQKNPSEPGRVRICFPLADGEPWVEGVVDTGRWFPPDSNPPRGEPSDIAFIRLDQDAPASAEHATLKPHRGNEQAKVYGFRGTKVQEGWLSHEFGEWVKGEIVGSLPGGRAQFDGVSDSGAKVERGYSGGGIYVAHSDSVVGMIVEKDRVRNVAQFIGVRSLWLARGKRPAPPPARHAAPPHLVAETREKRTKIAETREKKTEIEDYLRGIGASLPDPEPDAELLSYLEPILNGDDATALSHRLAFGFPKAAEAARSIYNLAASNEPSMRPLLGILAQRLYHLLWRFEETLKCIPDGWAKIYKKRAKALQAICEPHRIARRPTLRDVAAALQSTKDLKAFTESAPDPTLYAVLRSFRGGDEQPSPDEEPATQNEQGVALDFLFEHLSQLIKGQRQIDDSSNAWWAVRTGIWLRDERFRDLLIGVANKYYDITVPREDLSRLAAVPEIYQPIRTSSYTLSNAQAIVEDDRRLSGPLKAQIREVIYKMRERLLSKPRSNQLYLASVHHEGLRNYLDYLDDQEREAAGADSEDAAARADGEGVEV